MDESGALLILDEIYTGFGRTGKWFACEHSGVIPDLVCLGKALTGGFPLSACVGRASLMDAAWPASSGEAMHTSTFLGHPVGCAMALAQIGEIEKLRLPDRSAELGAFLVDELSALASRIEHLQCAGRGVGLMAALELNLPDGRPATQAALAAIKSLLQRGYIFLPEGEHGNVISFTPPLTITGEDLTRAVEELRRGVASRMKLSEMREWLERRDIQLTKSLGQNFLHDAHQLERIVAAAKLTRQDQVLEIGPGLGPLTSLLLEHAGGVLAIEKDFRLVEVLRERFAAALSSAAPADAAAAGRVSVGKFELLHADALDFLKTQPRDWSDWKLVANLPYSVASPILVELAAPHHARPA